MFIKKNIDDTQSPIDLAITQALSDLQSFSVDSVEYAKGVGQIKELYKLKENNSKKSVSPDVLVNAGANLIGILAILQYERVHVITSKALSFVMKLK